MKNYFLMLSAVTVFLVVAAQARAGDRTLDAYLARAHAEAAAKVAGAGVDLSGRALTVQGRVGADGRLTAIHVVASSGSVETDVRAAQALKGVRVADPPPLLVGARVKVALGAPAILQASAP